MEPTTGETIEEQIKRLQKVKARLATIGRRLDKLAGERARLMDERVELRKAHGLD